MCPPGYQCGGELLANNQAHLAWALASALVKPVNWQLSEELKKKVSLVIPPIPALELVILREDLPKRRTFTFGYCPNQEGGRPLPESFGPLFTKYQSLNLVNTYSKIIILVCFLVIFVINFINIITITIIIIMSTIIIIICTDFCHRAIRRFWRPNKEDQVARIEGRGERATLGNARK